ncbi:MAG TPA: S41 family peptidase [Candidatus Babeliales bacterium]|nr:S41 family peptidase [Candidatus Babeliales bacterium]
MNNIYNRLQIIIFLLMPLALYAPATKNKKEEPKKTVNFDEALFNWTRTWAETMQITKEKHFNIQDPEEDMIKAIDAFISNLDPHSSFLDQKTYKHILETTSGEFFGIGIVIDNTRQAKDKFLLVVDTVAEGPADKAGVKPLDKIVEIDDQPLEGMTTDEATSKLKGERNTKVHIKILRENHPDIIALDITRDEIKEQSSLCFYMPDHQIYYFSLSTFSDNAVHQLEKLFSQIDKKSAKAIIWDLRNNSGGLLTSAIDIAGLILPKGSVVVSTKGKGEKEMEKYTTMRNPLPNIGLPIFILINNYTASAAEILAGCLKVHSDLMSQKDKKDQKKLMVFLVGTRTFGKGSVQEVIPVSNNCALKITTALYYLPQDIPVQGVGIEPDFVVEKKFPPTEQLLWFNKYYGSEKALNNSIKTGKESANSEEKKVTQNNKEKSWSQRAKDTLDKDNQLRETITIINMFHNAQTHCPQHVKNRKTAVSYIKNIYMNNEPITFEEIKM